MDQSHRAFPMAIGRDCCVPSFCVAYVSLGRCNVARSRQSGQLVAFSRRCSILSRISDDLAPCALTFFNEPFHGDGTARDLERGRCVDRWHNRGGDAIPSAPCRNQRVAALLSPRFGLRHRYRQFYDSVLVPGSHRADSGLLCRFRHRLSRQRGTVSGRVWRSGRKYGVKIRVVSIDSGRLANVFRAHLDLCSHLSD